jgi:hypothetical protein
VITNPRFALAAFGISAYLLMLAATIPASWLAWGLSFAKTPVSLDRAQGTVWNGRGSIRLQGTSSGMPVLSNVKWQINPFQLVIGRIGFSAKGQTSQINLSLKGWTSFRRVYFSRFSTTFPLELLSNLYPPASIAGLDGKAYIYSDSLYLRPRQIEGGVELRIESLRSSAIGRNTLGNYRIVAKAVDNVIEATVSTEKGPLRVTGNTSWKPMDSGEAQINARIDTSQVDSVTASIIRAMGRDESNGNVRLRWNGYIRP